MAIYLAKYLRELISFQYGKDSESGYGAKPAMMGGTQTSTASYNNAFQMVPTAGRLFIGFGRTVNSMGDTFRRTL